MKTIFATRILVCSLAILVCMGVPTVAQTSAAAPAQSALYNTAKQKILEGKQVFSFTQSKFDVAGYCEAAKHYDFTWFEMQHSTLEFADVEKMIAACPTPRSGTSSTPRTSARSASSSPPSTMWTARARPPGGRAIRHRAAAARG